jgi:hypothetical protein
VWMLSMVAQGDSWGGAEKYRRWCPPVLV